MTGTVRVGDVPVVRFRDPSGSVRIGEWTDDGIEFAKRRYDPESVDILAPTTPSKVVCLAGTYLDHIEEVGGDGPPDRPKYFLKGPNAVAGHGDTVPLLDGKERIDYEAELGVVIGRQCRHVDAADADDVIAGYTCGNDVSNRDDQLEEQNWIRGKAFDASAPIGPVVAPPGQVPADATIELRLNGEREQRTDRSKLLFSIPEVIEDLTRYVTLEPGDVILTGTPAGVGSLEPGDEVEVEIEGVGTLRHDVGAP